MDVLRGVGRMDVGVSFVYSGFPTRRVENLTEQFDLSNRIKGNNEENLGYIKCLAGVRLHIEEVASKDGVNILIEHPTIEGMKQGYEILEGLLEQVTSDFEALRERERISDLDWQLRYRIKTCTCPECGKIKNHIKDLQQHYNGQHVGEKYDTMTVKISGAPSRVKRSAVERALGEFGSISYVDMESHPRDIYVKFIRPVAVERVMEHKRKIMIEGKQVQFTRAKIGELEDLRESLKRKPKETSRHESADTSTFIPYQSASGWDVDKFMESTNLEIKSYHPTKIYVRGFGRETDRKQLKDFFNNYGRVEDLRIKGIGTSSAYAFVEFRTRVAIEKMFDDRDVSYVPYGDSQLTLKRVARRQTEDQLPDLSEIQPETVRQVYVEGFPVQYEQKELTSFFKVYGDVKKCVLVKSCGGQPRHAYVTFTNMDAVEELMKEMTEADGLYIRGNVLKIERRSHQIENTIRKRSEEKKRKLPPVEYQTGVEKTGLPLKDIKEKLDATARQLSSQTSPDFWSLRKQWEWLNTIKAELEKEAEWEIFGLPRSDGLKASTLAAAAQKLQEALEKLVGVASTKETTDSYTRERSKDRDAGQSKRSSWSVSTKSGGSAYDSLPIGTTLTGQDWRPTSQSASKLGTSWVKPSASISVAPSAYPGFGGIPVKSPTGFGAPVQPQTGFGVVLQGGGLAAHMAPYMGVPPPNQPASFDNRQTVDMEVCKDDEKQSSRWTSNPGKGVPYDLYRITVLGFTPMVQAKDLQKMFTSYGLARDVRIYLEHEIRYAFLTFTKQKAIRNLFKGKLGVHVTIKDMKLICNRIPESQAAGPLARLLSQYVEEVSEPSTSVPFMKPTTDTVPAVALPIQSEQLLVMQLLANVEHLISPPRAKPITEDEMLKELQEREVRMVPSLQHQLGQDNPETVVRILKHLRCIHTDVTIQKILYYLSNDDLVEILSSSSKPELVKSVEKHAETIEQAITDISEVNLYHCIRKMVLVMNVVAEKKRPAISRDKTAGTTEFHPIVISDTDPDPVRQRKPSRWNTDDTPTFSRPKKPLPVPLHQKRKGLQKILGELLPHQRQKVEGIFRTKVDERRVKGVYVSEEDEIDMYIEALGGVGKKPESDSREGRRDSKDKGKESEESRISSGEKGKNSNKEIDKRQSEGSSKSIPNLKNVDSSDTKRKGRSTSNGKISLEGLSTLEKRISVKKAMDEIPPFVASKIKGKQKVTVNTMKKEGKNVGEVEELEAMAEAFNHMFNEEGNVMAHVLKDQIFKRRGELLFKKESAIKQLYLPKYDKQVKLFKEMEPSKQTEEMKNLRESLSVLLKIYLFKKQDKVFEDAESSGISLTKEEKNIVRYQILLDMTQAVVAKQSKSEEGALDISGENYQAECDDSQDEFDEDVELVENAGETTGKAAQKRAIEESEAKSMKKLKVSNDQSGADMNEAEAIVIDDDEDDKEEVKAVAQVDENAKETDPDMEKESNVKKHDAVAQEDNSVDENNAVEQEDEFDKLLEELSSDDDDVIVDDYDETKLLEEIQESCTTDKDSHIIGKTAAAGDIENIENKDDKTEEICKNVGIEDSKNISDDAIMADVSPDESSENHQQGNDENSNNENKDSNTVQENNTQNANEEIQNAEDSMEAEHNESINGSENQGTTQGLVQEENNEIEETKDDSITQYETEEKKDDDITETTSEVEESEEQMEEKFENAFHETLSAPQRRSILGRMTKAKKARVAAGSEMTEQEISDLRYKMIKDALAKLGK